MVISNCSMTQLFCFSTQPQGYFDLKNSLICTREILTLYRNTFHDLIIFGPKLCFNGPENTIPSPVRFFLILSRVVAKTIFDICRWATVTAARAVALGCCMYVQGGPSMMWFSTLSRLAHRGRNTRGEN